MLIIADIALGPVVRWLFINISYAALANIADWGLLFFQLIIIGRFLGPVAYGDFFTAYVLVALAFRLTEIGLNIIVNREVARNRNAAGYYLGNALSIRLVSAGATGLVLLAGLTLFAVSPVVVQGVVILTIYYILWYLSQLCVAIFRAYERMDLTAWVTIAERGVTLLVSVGMLLGGASLLWVELAFVIGGLVGFIISLALVQQVVGWPHLHTDFLFWRMLLRKSAPLGLIGVLTMIYFRIDTLLLSFMVPDSSKVVGWYNAAYTLFYGATLPATSTYFGIFPVFARLHVESPARLQPLFRVTLLILGIVSLFVGMLLYIFAHDLIRLIYGNQYYNSVDALKVLAFAIPSTYFIFLINAILPAVDRVRDFVITVAASSVTNVVMNLILIPNYGAVGAASATVVTQFLAMAVGMIFVTRYIRQLHATLSHSKIGSETPLVSRWDGKHDGRTVLLG